MNTMRRIRHLLNLSQIEMAEVANVNQATVSRWEQGKLDPGRSELSRIRSFAMNKGVKWDDALFFEQTGETEPSS